MTQNIPNKKTIYYKLTIYFLDGPAPPLAKEYLTVWHRGFIFFLLFLFFLLRSTVPFLYFFTDFSQVSRRQESEVLLCFFQAYHFKCSLIRK